MINKDYKETLLMPLTNFPMKGNLSQKEIDIQNKWKNIKLYDKVLEKNKNNISFFFMMVLLMLMEIFISDTL